MTNLIIGAGVIGLTTALELLHRGEQVTLIDARKSEAMGTSFANGGLLTPSMSDPWNAPGVHRHLFGYLVGDNSALRIRWSAIPSLLSWGPRFLLNSRAAPYRMAIMANYDLGIYSLAALQELQAELGLAFEATDKGTIKFFRSQEALDASMSVTRQLQHHGLEAHELNRGETVRLEPCLTPIADQLVGAIHYPKDMSGDAYMFCQAIARRIRELGGTFQFESEVRSVKVANGAVAGVDVGGSVLAAKNVIIAAGTASPELARQIGARLAIKPVKGYSLTFTPEPGQRLPAIPVIDDANHTAVTPFGKRLRSVGTAEFAGSNLQLDRERLRNLAEFFKAVFPEIATRKTLDTGQPWAGLRPVAADGRPYIGATRTRGLWINSGHGHLGWTLATGSARLLADLIVGRQTEIAAEPYAVAR